MNTTHSQRCASCPTQIKAQDPRVKIGKYTYCEVCAAVRAIEVPKK